MPLKSWVAIAGIAVSSMVGVGSFDRVGAVTTVLYDGTSGVTPDLFNAPNPYLSFTNLGTGTQAASGGVTTLDTAALEATYAGYSNYNSSGNLVNSSFPILDNSAGYTLSFTVKVNSQTNNGTNGNNRAGFSALVLGSNNRGIEIGFRKQNTTDTDLTPDIFSQNGSNFIIGEQNTNIGTILDSTNTYELNVLGNNYQLTSGGNILLTGLVRDYTNAVGPLSPVYRTPSFIFLGDNTTSAGGSVNIANIALTTNATNVPEPSNWIGIGLAIGFGVKLKSRLSKSNLEFTKLLK
jgi:hypothetical protein